MQTARPVLSRAMALTPEHAAIRLPLALKATLPVGVATLGLSAAIWAFRSTPRVAVEIDGLAVKVVLVLAAPTVRLVLPLLALKALDPEV